MIPALLSSAFILWLYWRESRGNPSSQTPTAPSDPAARLAAVNDRLDAIRRHVAARD